MAISDEVLAAITARFPDSKQRKVFLDAHTTGITHAVESLEIEMRLDGFEMEAWISRTHGRVAHLRERGGL